jgi:long-chain acyl-CoA synthetase
VAYIVGDSGSKVFISSPALNDIAQAVVAELTDVKLFMVGEPVAPFESFEAARASMPTTPVPDESAGTAMLYSSGTTGRPKGVKRGGNN